MMNDEEYAVTYKRGFFFLVVVIAIVTVMLAAVAGRTPTEILAYLGFTTGISYIFFG